MRENILKSKLHTAFLVYDDRKDSFVQLKPVPKGNSKPKIKSLKIRI